VENRIPGADANPYLVYAALLAAGLDGIERKLDSGEPNSENLYSFSYDELRARGLETLPSNLLMATHELAQDEVLREALGAVRDEDYVDYFIRVKLEEWNRYHEQVTPWEIREYLTRF
jgi:glutamine synthetase